VGALPWATLVEVAKLVWSCRPSALAAKGNGPPAIATSPQQIGAFWVQHPCWPGWPLLALGGHTPLQCSRRQPRVVEPKWLVACETPNTTDAHTVCDEMTLRRSGCIGSHVCSALPICDLAAGRWADEVTVGIF